MPIHDWTKMLDGDFHHFHQRWIQDLVAALNEESLPDDYYAISEQVTAGPIPDVVTLKRSRHSKGRGSSSVAVHRAPPSAKLIARLERNAYAKRADRIAIRRGRDEVVAIVEIVSPGNKHSTSAFQKFITKTAEFVQNGIHMLIVDVPPPTARDPNGIQQAICDALEDGLNAPLDSTQNRTAGAYFSGEVPTAYLECFGVGEPIPPLPLFLNESEHVIAPLESSYMRAWEHFPRALKLEMHGES